MMTDPQSMTARQDRDDSLLREVAGIVERRGLRAPALLLLEMHKPLSVMMHSAMIVAAPVLSMAIGAGRCRRLIDTLQEPENIERLIRLIESGSAESRATIKGDG